MKILNILFIVGVLFLSCDSDVKKLKSTIAVNSVQLGKNLDLAVGETKTLTVAVLPTNATNKKVSWSSDKTAIATVNSQSGEVTGMAVGTAIITATATSDSTKTASRKVYVYNVDLKNVETKDTNIGGQNGVSITKYTGTKKDLVLPPVINGQRVLKIEGRAFAQNQLTNVVIPDSVTTIGEWAFSDNQLTSLTIPDSVKTIEGRAFAQNQLTNVVIPNSVKTIGYGAFGFNQLTSVTIPDSVMTIDSYAFYQNPLTSLTIKRTDKTSLTKIKDDTFGNTPLKDGNNTTQVTITVPNGLINDYKKLWKSKIDADAGIKWKE